MNIKSSPIHSENSLGGDLDSDHHCPKKPRMSEPFKSFKLEQYDDYNSSSNASILGNSPPEASQASLVSDLAMNLSNYSLIYPGTTTAAGRHQITYKLPEPTTVMVHHPTATPAVSQSSCQATSGPPGGGTTIPKPSEAMFVRLLLRRCKRLAPLWFRGVSSMREKNREENRRATANSTQSQQNWGAIAEKISEMSPSGETDAVGNLLKKLYKELPPESVFWFIKCWLQFPEARSDTGCCLSRGDAKGRMRRIDGGKGSDKVWRLDTIVGMLYHGLPMSSTDTNIMIHTCEQELCVRPQHLRFRASSVALVVVLKALEQEGYHIQPPSKPISYSQYSMMDEAVDVSGPFSIEELQRYRSEEVVACKQTMGKYVLNSTDTEFLETNAFLKECMTQANEETGLPAHATAAAASRHTTSRSSFPHVPSPLTLPTATSLHDPPTLTSSFVTVVPSSSYHRVKRSLTPTAYSTRPENGTTGTLSPPRLTSQAPVSAARPSAFTTTTTTTTSTSLHQRFSSPATVQRLTTSLHSPALGASVLGRGSPAMGASVLSRGSPAMGVSVMGRGSPAMGGSVMGPSGSGKNTPRQPAKKRLEARTPTLELELEDMNEMERVNEEHQTSEEMKMEEHSEFVVHTNTSFTPVNRHSDSSEHLLPSSPHQHPNPPKRLSPATGSTADLPPPPTRPTPQGGDCERELQDILGGSVTTTIRPTPMRPGLPHSGASDVTAFHHLLRNYPTSPQSVEVVKILDNLMAHYGVSFPRPASIEAHHIYSNFRNAASVSPLNIRHLSFTPLSVDSDLNHPIEGRASSTLRTPDFLPPSLQLPTSSGTPNPGGQSHPYHYKI